MRIAKYIFLLSFILPISLFAQNGRIIEKSEYQYDSNKELLKNISFQKDNKTILKPDYQYLNEVVMQELFYESDGLKVKAFLSYPKKEGKYPIIIYNRGGNRDFGSLNEFKMVYILAKAASWGYVVIGSQYRGVDGGEGMEEFGGKDVNDVLNLIPLTHNLPNADSSKIGMYGWSRGGMMTLLSLMKTDKIKAAVIGGAVSDLRAMNDTRGGEMEKYVYSELMPNYEENKEALLDARSAIIQVDKICKTSPFLILHGTADWRVIPEESLNLAIAFQKEQIPYRLVMLEGGDHGLSEFKKEVNEMVKNWFDKYLKKGIKNPNLHPHGK